MRKLAFVVATAAIAACTASQRPASQKPAAVTSTNATCESCHTDVAKEQQASFHRMAFTDSTFQASLALEDPRQRAFCNGCHAPDGEAAGVGCIACHGQTPRSVHAAPKAPHAVRVDETFATSAPCAKCHEFAFDDGRPDLVQRTISEHAASDTAAEPCAMCHMERGNRKSHEFAAGHSIPWLRGSLTVTARRHDNSVRITIQSWAGHAFPTGDMFRRARLLVFAEREDGTIITSAERIFGRTWGHRADGLRQELTDTRIRGRFEELFSFQETAAPIVRVRWQVIFERVLAQRGENVTLVSSDVIAEGTAE